MHQEPFITTTTTHDLPHQIKTRINWGSRRHVLSPWFDAEANREQGWGSWEGDN
jgi:hypothetical protein